LRSSSSSSLAWGIAAAADAPTVDTGDHDPASRKARRDFTYKQKDPEMTTVQTSPIEPTNASFPSADLIGRRPDIGAFAYFEGAIVPMAQATVSIATHALNYGTAVFEGIRAYRQHDGRAAVLLGPDHYERFLRNGRLLRASVPESADRLLEITLDLLRRNEHPGDAYVRPLLYKSAHSIRLQLTDLEDRVSIFTMPLGDYLPTKGLASTVSGWQRVSDTAIPVRGKIAGTYVNAALASEDAHQGGYDDAILLTSDGHLAEASAANIFVVTGSEIATPPVTDDVLPGITRAAVIQIATDAGLGVVERRIDRSELYVADEVFLTGTGAQVAPIASIDGRTVGTGDFPVALDLQSRYYRAVRGEDHHYADWLTLV
jgi:branched-chain amino acid aminotransferase